MKSRRRIRPGVIIAAAMLGTLGWCVTVHADEALEYRVKAAFLFNFAKFVEWPAQKFTQADAPLIVGVMGSALINDFLEEAVQGKVLNEHPVVIKRVGNASEGRKCHLLFVCRSENGRSGPILAQVKGDNVLTVGESDNFVARGGMINFVTINNNVRFEIDATAAQKAGLKISSKLMTLALPSSR